jgi:hypothetical protein
MFDPVANVDVLKVFPWDGIDWTTSALLMRLVWIGAGLAALSLAIPLFDRFNPALVTAKTGRKKKKKATSALCEVKPSNDPTNVAYAELHVPAVQFSLVRMTLAELRLALKGYHWFWYLVAISLMVAQLATPFEVSRQYLTPISMIWPLVIWSSMGTRGAQFSTNMLLFSSPKPIMRQLPAIWLSGLVVAIASIGCMLIRSVGTGHLMYSAALAIGALVVPSSALVLGVLSTSRRLFEVTYLMIWYVGSIEQVVAIDLLGTTEESITAVRCLVLCSLAVVSLATAFGVRRMQVLRP